MNERLKGAIEELEDHLSQQLNEVAETKRTINALCRRMGADPRYEDAATDVSGSVRPDQYYGKSVTMAAAEFLERRKQRGACKGEEILQALNEGGFDFEAIEWKEKDRLRLLSASLAKNPQKFHRLPNGTFGLLAWYDQNAIKQKKEERKQNGSASTDEPAASDPEGDQKASA